MSEHVSSSQQSSSATSRTCFCAAAEQSPALSTLYSEICRSIAGPSSMPAEASESAPESKPSSESSYSMKSSLASSISDMTPRNSC